MTPTGSAGRCRRTCAGRPNSGGGRCPDRRADPVAARRRLLDLRATPTRCRNGCRCSAPTRLPAAQLRRADRAGGARDVHLLAAASVAALWTDGRRVVPPRPAPRRDDPTVAARRASAAVVAGARRPGTAAAAAPRTRRSTGTTPPDRDGADRPRCSGGCRTTSGTTGARTGDVAPLAPDDRSIQVHACHGPSRQVDVLREVLVGLLGRRPHARAARHPGDVPGHRGLRAADRGGVRPRRDVVAGRAIPAHRLRVRLADRALTQTNPLLATVARLLELADAPGHRVAAAGPRRLGAGPPPLRLRRRRPGPSWPAGSPTPVCAGVWTRRTERPFGLGGVPAEHLARRAGPDPARRRDGRRGPTAARRSRCRWTTSAAATSTWPAGSPSCVDRLPGGRRRAAPATARSRPGSTR